MNWGQKLILVFVVFGSMMSYLVYRCVKTNYDLVSKDYYKDELVYQQVIDGTKKAAQLGSKFSAQQNGQVIKLNFPNEMKNKKVSGEIWFYCTVDAKKDKKFSIKLNQDAAQEISSKLLAPGGYDIKVNWDCQGEHYYVEQEIYIQ